MIRLHLADDHGVFRFGLKAVLEREPDIQVVGETSNGFDTLRWFEENVADLLLLDISMPGLPGATVASALRERGCRTAILVLTMHDDEYHLREFFRLGCSGYMLKSSSGDDLMRAIRSVANGQVYVDPSMSHHLVASLSTEHKPERGAEELTSRERDVCRLLAMGHTNAEVADLLHLSRRTVEGHRCAIMSKLGLKTRADLVRYAIEHRLTSDP